MSGADVTGVVGADIEDVWSLFRQFGSEVTEWWPIYKSVEIKSSGSVEIGCVRVLQGTDGNVYHERLDKLDDESHSMQYTMIDVSPAVPTLKQVEIHVEMSSKEPGKTLIHWWSEIDSNALVSGKIADFQAQVYSDGIKYLDRHFNPALGSLDVEVVNATGLQRKGLFAPNPYVVLDLDNTGPKSTMAKLHTTAPKWNEKVTLEVDSLKGQLRISVWDENHLSEDDFLGSIEFDLHELTVNKRQFKKFKLSEVGSGELTLSFSLSLNEGSKLGETDESKELDSLEEMKHVMNELKDQALHTLQELSGADPDVYGYERYPRTQLYPDVDLENLPKMVDVLHLPQTLPPEKLGRLMKRISEYLYSQVNFLDRVSQTGDLYKSVYGDWIDKSDYVVDHWEDDRELCRQLIQGVNPMIIRLCDDSTQIPAGLRELKAEGKSVDQLIKAKRLFVLDYEKIEGIPQYRDMCVYAPIALVYKEVNSDHKGSLNVLGFQLTRETDGSAEVFTPGDNKPLRYKFAKMHWMNADNQYHQFIEHLGNAHLAMEPLAIAHHNAFPKGHPIGDVLRPHFRETIGINYMARQTLVSPIIPFTDRTFSLGTAGSLWLFLKSYKEWDFKGNSFPERLKTRGFDEKGSDGLKDFYYRDDGFLIWNALTSYFADIVDAHYDSDEEVKADPCLKKLCDECNDSDKANVRGFPEVIENRAALVEVMTTIVFNCSAQHSAVNFSQYPYVSFIPNRPDSMFAWMPEDRAELTQEFINSALPNLAITHFQALFAWLLTTPTIYPLAELEGAAEHFPELHKKHTAEMKKISSKIRRRNKKLQDQQKVPYPFLDPMHIASSIDI